MRSLVVLLQYVLVLCIGTQLRIMQNELYRLTSCMYFRKDALGTQPRLASNTGAAKDLWVVLSVCLADVL